MMMFFVLLGAIGFWVLYKYWVSIYKHWEVRTIPFIAGTFPFGTHKSLKQAFAFQGDNLEEMYRKVPGPYFGMYSIRTPFLVVKDPDIIKLVLAKEFAHFRDRAGFEISKDDVLSNHLFNLEGERWRALRVKMSPTFTSGKLKGMFPLFVKCAEVLDALLLTHEDSDTDVKDIVGRFTVDTICSCAFGIDTKTMKNTDETNDIRKLGDDVFVLDLMTKLRMLFMKCVPGFIDKHPVRLVSKSTEDTLVKIIRETVEYRTKNGVKRNDFIDLLIELKEKGTLSEDTVAHEEDHHANSVEMTIEMMAAQAYVFFLAGFETSSSVQSYSLYELALHPEIQDRLYEEIESTIAKHGELSYQAIQEMEYLDMVIHEAMRKYPTLPLLTRRCTKPFSFPAGTRIEKGDRIVIPVWSLHRDPQYFPKPEVFDPERFSKENKETIKPYTYLPFGEGPRICIGMRFGLLQTKVGLITILRKYKVEPSEKTQIPLKFAGSIVITTVASPINLKISKRKALK